MLRKISYIIFHCHDAELSDKKYSASIWQTCSALVFARLLLPFVNKDWVKLRIDESLHKPSATFSESSLLLIYPSVA